LLEATINYEHQRISVAIVRRLLLDLTLRTLGRVYFLSRKHTENTERNSKKREILWNYRATTALFKTKHGFAWRSTLWWFRIVVSRETKHIDPVLSSNQQLLIIIRLKMCLFEIFKALSRARCNHNCRLLRDRLSLSILL